MWTLSMPLLLIVGRLLALTSHSMWEIFTGGFGLSQADRLNGTFGFGIARGDF